MTTTPQPQVDIEELEALAKAATPGPWFVSAASEVYKVPHFSIVRCAYQRDADYAATANPSAVLALIAETRALRAVKLRVHELADPFAGGGSGTMDEIERITR